MPFLPALLFSAIATLAIAAHSLWAGQVGEMAVVFLPGTDELTALQIVREAGGALSSGTQFDNVVIAVASDEGFQERARAAGALLFLSAAALCGVAEKDEQA